jgi:type IV secretion system protein VirD4
MAIASLLSGLMVATQYYAWEHGHAAVLGARIAEVYPPWACLQWAWRWYGQDTQAFLRAGSAGIVSTALLFVLVALYAQRRSARSGNNDFVHGSARWADRADIEKAGLMPRRSWRRPEPDTASVYVGSWVDSRGGQHYLRHSGPEHVLCIAPTRTGKGVGLVIPTLLSWSASAVVTDLKGELWALTAGWRRKHARNKVLLFEPTSSKRSCAWNPLDEIRIGTEHEVGDAQNLATLLVDPDGRGVTTHWQITAHTLLVGLILHVLYLAREDGTPATLQRIDATMTNPDRSVADLWVEMTVATYVAGEPHPVVAAAGRDMLDRPEEEAGSVLSTAKSYLALYRDPIVAANTSHSDFRIRDLMNHQSPVTLYILTEGDDKVRLRPLVRVLINMILRLSATGLTFKAGRPVNHFRHRLLLMIDEFPSLGKLDILQESLTYIAGYGLKAYLICQDLTHLRSRDHGYGPDETITSNCHVQAAFPPNRVETAEYLSKWTGQTTVTRERITTSGSRTALFQTHKSVTSEQTQRPLLTADECMRSPGPEKDGDAIIEPGDMFIYVAGCPAIYGRQPLYFTDPIFTARAAIEAPSRSDRLHERAFDLQVSDA